MKNLYLVMHVHRYGDSAYLIRSQQYPTATRVAEIINGIQPNTIELDRDDEWLEITSLGELEVIDLDL